jgi:crotonobetainyl-CoA:carnitine CoA-transferase CaiB-like acyl-CoA transferase
MGPLEGIRIVELSTWAVVPCACEIMGDWGADVIKIEHPVGGDPTRGWAGPGWLPASSPLGVGWLADNRSKRSIALDLSKEEGREIAYRLVEKADIFASNLQEPSLQKVHMDYETLKQVNPVIVYAHLTGYGRKGPKCDKPGFDYSAFWASSGIMSLIGEKDGPPAFQRPAMGDHMTTGYFTAGILAALRARDRLGIGQRVDISLMGTGLWIDSWQTQATLLTNEDAKRVSQKEMPNPLFNIYRAKDGRWFIFVMLFPDRFWPSFCRALDIAQLEHAPRFETAEKRAENRKELISIIEKVIDTKTSEEWVPIFDKYDLVWGYVHTIKSALEDPQTEANQFIVEVEHPELGNIRMVNSPVFFSETLSSPKEPPPLLGQHTEEILLSVGYDWSKILHLKNEGVII